VSYEELFCELNRLDEKGGKKKKKSKGGVLGEEMEIEAKKGCNVARYRLGSDYMKKGNYKEGLEYLQLSADGDYGPAQILLGYYYGIGVYIEKDLHRAEKYLGMAITKNIALAEYLLGVILIKIIKKRKD
jgi:TPR repeat protein